VRAFGGLCRRLRARELPNGSRGAFVGTQGAENVQTSSFLRLAYLQGCCGGIFLASARVCARRAGFWRFVSAFSRARASQRQPRCVCGLSCRRIRTIKIICAFGVFVSLLGWPFLGCSACLCAACGLLAVCVGICARASFPTAAEVRLWALREPQMCKPVHFCDWGIYKAA
jgi:hypothetical protein